MKKIFVLFMITVSILVFIACSSNNEENISQFQKYITDNNITLSLPSKLNTEILSVDIENRYNPRIIINIKNENEIEYLLDTTMALNDFKYIGDLYVDYAKSTKQSNDYYLSIMLDQFSPIIYDYEEQCLYLQKNYMQYVNLYKEFGTTDINQIEKKDRGLDYLVDNGFGTMKHNEFERMVDWPDYKPFINKGEYDEIGSSLKSIRIDSKIDLASLNSIPEFYNVSWGISLGELEKMAGKPIKAEVNGFFDQYTYNINCFGHNANVVCGFYHEKLSQVNFTIDGITFEDIITIMIDKYGSITYDDRAKFPSVGWSNHTTTNITVKKSSGNLVNVSFVDITDKVVK